MINDDFVYDNEEESEMGQLHAIHLNLNAIAAVRQRLAVGPSKGVCKDCGDPIPLARQKAAPGVQRCILCQTDFEKTAVRAGL